MVTRFILDEEFLVRIQVGQQIMGDSSVGRARNVGFLKKNRTANFYEIVLLRPWSWVRVPLPQQNVGVAEVVSCTSLIRRRRWFESTHRHKFIDILDKHLGA